MTTPLILLLICILSAWAVSTLAELLNALRRSPTPPAGLEDIHAPEAYARSQDYASANTRLRVRSDAVLTLATVLLLLFNGLPLADGLAQNAAASLGFGPFGTDLVAGLLFIGGLLLLSQLLQLPFSLYQTFVLEERFGFNRTTPATFILDRIKGLLLGAVIGGTLLSGILWLLHAYGPGAWIGCWALAAVVMFTLQLLAPVMLPLFFRFEPLEQGPLRRDIEQLAQRVGFSLTGLFTVDGSRRSAKGNAFFTGLGNKRRIALFDTLLNDLSRQEIVAVLGHELGHWKLGHIRRTTLVGVLKIGALLWLFFLLLRWESLFTGLGLQPSPHAGLLLFGLLMAPLSLVLDTLHNLLSRRHEFQADRYAAEVTKQPEALASALRKLARQHLANLTPHPLYVALNHSHPPLAQRLAALESLAAQTRHSGSG